MSSPLSRRRVAVACTPCRVKKIRCDGKLPVCERCADTNTQCIYNHKSDRRKPPSKVYVEALLSRIGVLERQLQHLSPRQTTHQDTQHHKLNLFVSFGEVSESNMAPTGTQAGATQIDSSEPNVERDLIDHLTQTYGHLDVAEDGHLRYFGAPSYFNLLRRPQYEPKTEIDEIDGIKLHEQKISSGLSLDTQNHLLDLFWTWQNPWQYLVHKRVFCEALERGLYDDYCTPLLLQSILALSARYSDRVELRDAPDQPHTAGNALGDQAKAILHFEMERPTTSTVVAIAILALYEMSVNKEALGWTFVGMAIRIAYNLGLNHDCSDWVQQNKITEDQAEIRKITWWGCFLLDKLFVVALGRPGMIQQRDITIGKPSLLDEVEWTPWKCNKAAIQVSIDHSRSVTNMQYTCTIFSIGAEALEEMYAPNSRLSLAEKEEKATRAYMDLSQIYNTLPSCLRLPTSAKSARPAHIYSLHLQYYTIAILLHRPFLRHNKHEDPLQHLTSDVSAHHNEVCVHSAERISAIMRAYRTHYTLKTIPISTVHAVGTASIIQLLGATSRDILVAKTAARLLKFNILCLQEMAHAWEWSLRAIRAIQILAEEWAVSETIQINQQHRATDQEDAVGSVGDQLGPTDDISEDFKGGDEPDWAALGDSTDLAWLMQLDSSMMDANIDEVVFDQHLWPAGF